MATQPSSPKRGRNPQFSAHLLRPNGCINQDATWYGGRPQPRRLCVRWRPSFPSPKRGRRPSPQFSAHVHCGQTAGCIKLPLGVEIGLSPGDFVTDGDPSLFPRKGRSPQFSAHVYCGQTAAWIKMLIGTEVGVGLRDIVLDGDPASLPKGAQPPIFGHCLLWPNGWMY